MLAEDREPGCDQKRVQAAHVGLPVEEDRPLARQDMPGHQGHHGLVGIERHSPHAQQHKLPCGSQQEDRENYSQGALA